MGLLNHACKVVRSGRTFLRRMIALLAATGQPRARRPFHHVRLNREFRADLTWWRTFLYPWNGVGLIRNPPSSPGPNVTSDASGSWGCGAWHNTAWFQYPWGPAAEGWDIAAKELIPIVVAAAVWGPSWSGTRVTCYCDNQAVVSVLQKRSCRDHHLMHLLRCLFFVEAHFCLELRGMHIAGSCNAIADALSRDNLPSSSHFSPRPTVTRPCSRRGCSIFSSLRISTGCHQFGLGASAIL